jgi:hypothetical protein
VTLKLVNVSRLTEQEGSIQPNLMKGPLLSYGQFCSSGPFTNTNPSIGAEEVVEVCTELSCGQNRPLLLPNNARQAR